MVFAIHQHESAVGIHVSLPPEPPSHSLSTPSLQVVTEHRFWGSGVIHYILLLKQTEIWKNFPFSIFYLSVSLSTLGRSTEFSGFAGGSVGKESTCNERDLGSVPELKRSPGGGHGNPLQYTCLENPHGQRSLAGYSPWGYKESDTTEQLTTAH